MKKWTITILAAMAIEAQAGDFVYKDLVFTDTQGNTTSIATKGLKLTVADGSLVAVNSDGTTTFTLSQLATMAFSETAMNPTTAIEALPALPSSSIEAYSLKGERLGTFDNMTQLKNTLVKGIYIVKQNGTTKKITIK